MRDSQQIQLEPDVQTHRRSSVTESSEDHWHQSPIRSRTEKVVTRKAGLQCFESSTSMARAPTLLSAAIGVTPCDASFLA